MLKKFQNRITEKIFSRQMLGYDLHMGNSQSKHKIVLLILSFTFNLLFITFFSLSED